MTESSLPYPVLKRCHKCNQEFPATTEYFHRDASKKYGVASRCKTCCLAYQAKYSKENSEKKRAAAKLWAESNPDKARRNKRNSANRHHEQVLAYHAGYRADNPDKVKARKLVNLAVLRQEIPRADALECTDCGKRAAEYHHPDYEKPFEVVPLCRSCHAKRHL